jgi:hypothetical protein
MVSIINRSPASARIRASWICVQRALFDAEKARSTRRRHLDMSGEANLLCSGAKAINHGNGIWTILGYSADGSDIDSALEKMSKTWIQRMVDESIASRAV